jgi:hypothetical protein
MQKYIIKMKNIRIIILSVFITQSAFAQYYTPGTGIHWNLDDVVINSGGIMTFENNKYYLWDGLILSLNDTISIMTDEELRIAAGIEVKIYGSLICDPPNSLIIAAMDTTTHFKGMSFDNSDGSSLQKCNIGFGGGIKLIDSDIMMDSCLIRKSDQSNCTGTIDMIHSNPVIQNCRIYDNMGPAILSAANGSSSPQITANQLLQNCSANLNMPQINLGTSSPADSIRIIGNTITGLYDNAGGIAVATLAGGTIKAIIDGNTIQNNRYGITAYGMNIYTRINDNLITDNDIQGDPMLGGSGINFWGDQTNISFVSGNEISGNLWGITVQNQAMPNFGQVEPDTLNPGKNLIYDNGNNGVTYALYNNTPNDLFAENNYWGTFDPDTVEDYIFHQPDDPALGFVDYLPIKDYFTSIAEKEVCKFTYLKIFPNPAEEIIYFEFQKDFFTTANLKLNIRNLYGQLLSSADIRSTVTGFDISFLPAGVYIIQVSSGNRDAKNILIKQ